MTRSKTLLLAAAGALATMAAGTATLATAASPAATAVTTRQANFKKMGGAMKVLKDQLAGGTVDKGKAVAAARALASLGRAQPRLFPKGSDASSGVKTGALPAVWTDRAGFDRQWQGYVAQADKLVVAANTGNAAAIGAQFKALGATCSSCHRQYRAD